jgi:hypothetical protein
MTIMTAAAGTIRARTAWILRSASPAPGHLMVDQEEVELSMTYGAGRTASGMSATLIVG